MPGPGATLEPEWSLLLTACSEIPRQDKIDRIRLQSRQPIRWKLLFDLADRHGILPFLYRALADLPHSDLEDDAVPPSEMSRLRQSDQNNLHKALLLSRELIRIVDHIRELGLEVMPYKGLALAEAVYGDIALRQAGDIDLLIHPQDLPRIRQAARELGYTPHLVFSPKEERAYLKSGYEYAFDGAAGPNLLEVQWAIQPRFYSIAFDMPALFRRAVTINVAGHPMKTPSLEDLLLVLSAHAAKHAWGRLIWLCDIARLMSIPALNWNWIGSQADLLGISRILSVTMLLANRLLGTAIPAAAPTNLSKDPAVPSLVDEIRPHLAGESAYNVESLSYFRLMMRLRERGADRRSFLRRLIFTPGPSEWQAVRLPEAIFPLYRLVRLSRLTARLLRS